MPKRYRTSVVKHKPTEPEELYEVEAMLNHKNHRGERLYLVKWRGYPESDATWEPEGKLLGSCSVLFEQYLRGETRPQFSFARGNVVEKIKGMKTRKGDVFFEVTWVGSDSESSHVSNKEMYKHAPQQTLQFYEEYLRRLATRYSQHRRAS
jgi:hypothetical protein